jgi:uncharacterized protein YlaI
MSGLSSDASEQVRSKIHGFLPKPCSRELMLKTIRRVQDGKEPVVMS